MDRIEQEWTGQNKNGQDRTRMDMIKQEWT